MTTKAELEKQKLQKLILLGEEVHYLVRTKNISEPKLCALSEELIGIDKELHAFSSASIPKKGDGICPTCKASIGTGKFCTSCGTNVEEYYSKSIISCKKCEGSIDSNYNYCPICGNKNEEASNVL